MIQDHRQFSPRAAYSAGEASLIARFSPLVRKLAWHLAPSAAPALDVDDLMQIGLVALTHCARRHDRPTEDGLAAYAKLRVRGAMIDAIRQMQAETRSARRERQQLDQARSALAHRLGHPPSEGELAQDLGISASELSARIARAMPVSHVEMGDCYDETSGAFASAAPDAEGMLIEVQSRAQLARAIASLGERHQLVIQLYFLEELNLAEIADLLEISVPRVHQLKAAALKGLRAALAE